MQNKRFQRTSHKVRRPLNRDVVRENMKILCTIIIIFCSRYSYGEERNQIPEKGFPSSITHYLSSNGHEYVISGAYVDSRTELNAHTDCFSRIWTNLTLNIDLPNKCLIIHSENPLPAFQLQKICNQSAQGSVLFPYWTELLSRDRKSTLFDPGLFTCVYTNALDPRQFVEGFDGMVPHSIHRAEKVGAGTVRILLRSRDELEPGKYPDLLFGVRQYLLTYRNGQYSLQATGDIQRATYNAETKEEDQPERWRVILGQGKTGTLHLDKVCAYCMCHDRFALRLYMDAYLYIWEDTSNAFCRCSTWVMDIDGDGMDDILMLRNDHDKCHLFVYRQNTKGAQQSVPGYPPQSVGSPEP